MHIAIYFAMAGLFYYLRNTFPIRFLLLVLCFLVGSVLGICLSAYCYVSNQRANANYFTGRVFSWLVNKCLGLYCTFDTDLEKLQEMFHENTPCVLICNHQSTLDLFCMASFWPKSAAVIAKKSVKYYPFLGWHLVLAQNIFIDRQDRGSAIGTMTEAAKSMREKNCSVFLFPEGTRSHAETPGLLPFKKGAFHMALQAKVKIIPIVFANYSNLYSFSKMRLKSGEIPVKILEPVDTSGYTNENVTELMDICRQRMTDALVGMKSEGKTVKIQ